MEFDFTQQPGLGLLNGEIVKTEHPMVSIITPFYNDQMYIRQTFCCVLNQTFPYFEWIIVNDGSTDAGSRDLLTELAAQDPRIRILDIVNSGPSAARNYGIRHARADLILPLDADDLIEPTFLEYCWWMLEKNPNAAWAYTDSVGFDGMEYLWQKRFDPILLKTENHLTITALIRKEAFLSIGCYSEERKKFNEDWHAWLKLTAKGCYPVQCTGEYLFWYRRSDTGVLSEVQTLDDNARENRRIIEEAAKAVVNPPSPVIYPQSRAQWFDPKLSQWPRTIYKQKEKKHILFLFPHLVMGGADKFNLDLIRGLDKSRYDVSVLTTIPSQNDWLQRFRAVTPNIFNLANFMDPKDYGEFISYYIKSRQVDVLFVSNSFHGYYLIPWLREQFPELAIVDYVHMEEWYWRGGGYARTSAVVGAVTEKTYVCNSATRDVLIDHFGRKPESVETVHIGVDADHFKREAVTPGTLYKELDISPSRPIVLFICRLHPQKRPFMMLEIAKKVSQHVPDVAFAVVGNGPQEAELREKAEQMGLGKHVYFLGARKEVRPYYRDARVTLVCSLKEGLSLTAYESCAMGVPVVSADVGGQKDLVDDQVGALIPCRQSEAEGFDARQFPEEEVADYARAITELLTKPECWEKASHSCRKRVENGFTIGNMVAYFDREFQRLTTEQALRSQRIQTAQALRQLSPLAAELHTLQAQVELLEGELNARWSCQRESLLAKVLRVLREDGVGMVFRKTVRYLRKRWKR